LFYEDPILGTGGALKNAEAFLNGWPFLVHNGDVLSGLPLEKLLAENDATGDIATLAVHDHPAFNSVGIGPDGAFTGLGERADDGVKLMAFTGVAVYSPGILALLPQGVSHVTAAWEKARAEGRRVGSVDVGGCAWHDVGTPASYARAAFSELEVRGERVFIHDEARAAGIHSEGFLIMEGEAEAVRGTRLAHALVLPGARVQGFLESAVAGNGFSIPLPEPGRERPLENALLPDGKGRGVLVGQGGSDRCYYRVTVRGVPRILMTCPPGDPQYADHMKIQDFLLRHGFPVAAICGRHDASASALFEDLCDDRLYDWLKFNRDPAPVEGMYKQVLEDVARLHGEIAACADELPMLRDRQFDAAHLRWESGYFLERFVLGVRGTDLRRDAELIRELDRLAERVASLPRTLLHRDLQSQNIMIPPDGRPRFVDVQGMRMGPAAYDIASLLWDPYAPLDDGVRQTLVDFYIAVAGLDAEAFACMLLPCRLQRHMQALGAYGFLALIKGKRHFLSHAPEDLRWLKKEAAQARGEYPALDDCVQSL
jgi:aminoglycoside/choline kinase family phosphotransferase